MYTLYALIFLIWFGIPGLFIYLMYWILKKSGRKKLGTIVSIVLILPFLMLTLYLLFDDLLFSKSDARQLLSEHHITLNDDFKIISNQSGEETMIPIPIPCIVQMAKASLQHL